MKRSFALLLVLLALWGMMPVTALAATYTGTVNHDKVFLRVSASTDSKYYDLLNKGTKVTIIGSKGEYYKVKYKTYTGFMMMKFVDAPSAARKEYNADAKQTSRYAAVSSISGLGAAPGACQNGSSGDHVEKLQRALQIKGYLKGTIDGKYGNMTADAVKRFQTSAGLKATGKADTATINALFGKGSPSSQYDPGMKGITSISSIKVPNTSKPGNSGAHVKALQQALKLKGFYKGNIDSSYGEKTVDAVKRYQRSVGLTPDGIAGNGTIRSLFGKIAANHQTSEIPTKKLDWFNGGKNVIPQWASFTVKDVATGKTFSARRWSGYNHLDAEPLTKEDAAVMKAISGGSFSWNRRAVLVRYNGQVYAASINTMPHGEDTIPGNGFDGHFCIHFYQSKTHDTNRVDSSHQNAVKRAMNSSW